MEYLNKISFTCFPGDKPLDVQLEPEAFIYTVYPGEEITFISICSDNNFKWVVRVNQDAVQLFPDARQAFYGIKIYKNGTEVSNLAN